MPKYLLEVPHEAEKIACAKVVKVFLSSGSHFLSHADWGCKDGVHNAWLTVDVDSREEARAVLPPAFRSAARIVQLNSFTMKEIDALLEHHED